MATRGAHDASGSPKYRAYPEYLVPVYKRLRATFESGKTRDLEWRMRQLRGLLKFCRVHAVGIFFRGRKTSRSCVVQWAAVPISDHS